MALPIDQRVAPRPAKAGTLDLTASRQFIDDVHWHGRLEGIVKKHCPDGKLPFGERPLLVTAILRILLRSLKLAHGFWHSKVELTLEDVTRYDLSIDQFAKCWHAFKWKPSVWVHWMVAHSGYYIHKHRSLYFFSSIPCEHRHQGFKRDLRHCFQGWKLLRPSLSVKGVCHVVELDSIDQALRLLDANEPPQNSKKRMRL